MQGLYKKETQLTSYLSSGNTIGDFQGITEFFLQSGKTPPDLLPFLSWKVARPDIIEKQTNKGHCITHRGW